MATRTESTPDAPTIERPDAMSCHALARHLAKLYGDPPEQWDSDKFVDHCTDGYTREQVECAMRLTEVDTRRCLPHIQWAD